MLENLPISDWLHRAGEVALSREILEVAVLQLVLVFGILALAWGIRLATRGVTARLGERIELYFRWAWLTAPLNGLATLIYAWLLLVIAKTVGIVKVFKELLIGRWQRTGSLAAGRRSSTGA